MNDIQKVWIILEEGSKETMFVSSLGNNHYRLESTPLMTFEVELYWGDVIEADVLDDGTLLYRRIVEQAPLKHTTYILSKNVIDSTEFANLLESIKIDGGHTENVMGGLLLCHLPQKSFFNIDKCIKEIAQKYGNTGK